MAQASAQFVDNLGWKLAGKRRPEGGHLIVFCKRNYDFQPDPPEAVKRYVNLRHELIYRVERTQVIEANFGALAPAAPTGTFAEPRCP